MTSTADDGRGTAFSTRERRLKVHLPIFLAICIDPYKLGALMGGLGQFPCSIRHLLSGIPVPQHSFPQFCGKDFSYKKLYPLQQFLP
jgi:hypothetical protein